MSDESEIRGRIFDPREEAEMAEAVREAGERQPVWDLEPVPLLMDAEEPHPVMLLVMADQYPILSDTCDLSGEVEDIASALERSLVEAAHIVGRYPEAVRVRHPEVASALASALAVRDVAVQTVEVSPRVREMILGLRSDMDGGMSWPPGSRHEQWRAWHLPDALVAELFDAASALWRAAPWQTMAFLQAPRVTMPSGREWTASLMTGPRYGITLFSDPEDRYSEPMYAEDGHLERIHGRMIIFGLDEIGVVPDAAIAEAKAAGWQFVEPTRFPVLNTLNTPAGGVSRSVAEDLLGVTRALPVFVEVHQDALLRERESRERCAPIDWVHAPTGVRFVYRGEGVKQDLVVSPPEENLGDAPPWMVGELLDAWYSCLEEAAKTRRRGESRQAVAERAVTQFFAQNRQLLAHKPLPELGGLTGAELELLLKADWRDELGIVRFNRDLTLEELDGSDHLFNARVLLEHAVRKGKLAATEAGSFGVAVVRELVEHLRLGRGTREGLSRIKRVRESKVWELREVRVMAEAAGLLEYRRRHFTPTPEATALVDAERAGELFTRLFEAYFRRLDLVYEPDVEWPQLQEQLPWTLYRLTQVGDEWSTAESLYEATVLPYARGQAPRRAEHDLGSTIFAGHILSRLEKFALLEARDESPVEEYRATPLFTRFLTFDFHAPAVIDDEFVE